MINQNKKKPKKQIKKKVKKMINATTGLDKNQTTLEIDSLDDLDAIEFSVSIHQWSDFNKIFSLNTFLNIMRFHPSMV